MNLKTLLIQLGANPSDAEKFWRPLNDAMREFEINTTPRRAMFLAQILHESGKLRFVRENLNYSASALLRVFGKYFPNADLANRYARNPVMIANRCYGGRMGNGPEHTGDGWKYRGRGLIQLTGKNNYEACSRALGYNLHRNPDYLETPEGAARSAAWFWSSNGLNSTADAGDIRGNTRRINGGYNGLKDRVRKYELAMNLMGGKIEPQRTVQESAPRSSRNRGLYKIGSRGRTVAKIQQALGITADGIFGEGTDAAVKQWQAENGLSVDGIVGPATRAKLFG